MSTASQVSDGTPSGAVERAEAFGLDLTLLIENLRRTPTERLRWAERALHSVVAFQEEVRRARQQSGSRVRFQSVSGTQIEAILTRLAQAGVDFVVIGGVAGLAHGSARVTFDVDICYKRTPENIHGLCDTLAPLHPRLRGAAESLPFHLDPETVKAGLNFTLTTDLGSIDLLAELSGLGSYEGVIAVSETLTLYGLEMKVLSLEGLLVAKRAAARDKDREAIVELEALLELREKQSPS